ncbi:hypothetical protein LPB3_12160 [Polaribacter vadi]|uniref:TonB-dependent receptor plug domain-containing protein n=2 Tax=Polaribacter vadi TaxID=1774273 RepID=A0A1B8TTA7_9FLAO|nr:hypothetical protein LPB3_12160 [Polaribacter vadi]
MMRTFIFLFCTTLFCLTPKHVFSQKDKIMIDADKMISVDEVFKIIKEQTDYSFIYHENLFNGLSKVKLKKGVIRLKKLLSHSLSVNDIDIIFTANNNILIKKRNTQQYQISGRVTDQLGLTIPGVTVLIKGTNNGVATNLDGQYVITVSDPANVLVFSYLGFQKQEITVGNQTVINVILKEDISQLDEITINAGYYNTSERKRTGNISKVEAKTIEKQPVNNPIIALQGHVSGVNIAQNGGLPGGNFRIQIRGLNFLNGLAGTYSTENNPLYVIDGIPYDSGSLESNSTTEGFNSPGGVSPLNTVNPADIKSIEVLKDADATAIYGSRGANGVILITTKKGKVGKTQVKFNMSTTLSEVASFVDLLNTQQYLEVRREAINNDGYTLESLPDQYKRRAPDLYLWDQNHYTDWQEVLIGGIAYRRNVQLSFSGGNKFTQFMLSGGYSTESTVFPGDSKYDKTTLLVNINHQSEDEKFKLNFSGNYGSDTNNLPGNDLTEQARTLAPNAPNLFDNSGNLNWENFTWRNPLSYFEEDYNVVTRNLITNAVLSYHPIPTLEFKTSLGYTDYHLSSYWALPHTRFGPVIGYDSSNSNIIKNNGSRQSWIVEPQINWKHHLGKTELKVLVGATFQGNKDQRSDLIASGFASNSQILNLKAADRITVLSDTGSKYRYQSFFARVNLDYDDKYIVNLTGRRDGSSRFGPGKQFGYFGAVGAAWIFSEEKILENSKLLSFGKLRASYGITGSDNIGNYQFLDTYSGDRAGNYNGPGLDPTGLFNPNFAWGETKKLEAALDMEFFNNRVSLSTAWYHNRSSNQLIDIPLPITTGFADINGNFDALVQNTGLEIDLHTVSIKSDQFTWRTNFNISFNKNKLIKFDNLENTSFARTLVLGEPVTINKLFHLIGVDLETGVYQYEDYNNDGVIGRDDKQWLENLGPKYFGGLGNTLTYKNLQFEIFFQFTKQKIRSYFARSLKPGSSSNILITALDRWQQAGDQNPIQRYHFLGTSEEKDAQENYLFSNAGIIDGSFIRLRNVSLSYTLPKELIKGLDLNVYLQGQNLFVITKYDGGDPETPSPRNLSSLRQFTMGLNLSF